MALSIVGNALSLDGSTQYASRAIVSTVTDNFSVMAWVYLNAYPGAGLFSVVFNNGATDGNGYVLRISDTGVFSFDLSFVANLSSGYTLNTGQWYHIAVIRNAGTSQCYVNATAQGGTSASAPNVPGSFCTIGAGQVAAGTASKFVNGKIDDVRLYERAISTTELTQIYNRGSNTVLYGDIANTNLKQWFKLDETSGTNCADSSVTNLPMTTTGTPSFVPGIVEKKRETKFFTLRPAAFSPGIAR